jgi:hypothetical protein
LKPLHTLVTVALLWLLGALASAPAHGFLRYRTNQGIPVAWKQFPIKYYIGKNGSQNVTDGSDIDAIKQAFKTWSDVPCTSLQFVFGGLVDEPKTEYNPNGPNQNHIQWIEPPRTWLYATDALAFAKVEYVHATGEILDTDIQFNGHRYKWGTGQTPKQGHEDILNTATHEIGHLLGLDHSDVQNAAMVGQSNPGEITKRTLTQDDIDGICTIYPKDPQQSVTFQVVKSDLGRIPCPEPPKQTPTIPTEPKTGGCQSNPTQIPFLLPLLLVLLSFSYWHIRRNEG